MLLTVIGLSEPEGVLQRTESSHLLGDQRHRLDTAVVLVLVAEPRHADVLTLNTSRPRSYTDGFVRLLHVIELTLLGIFKLNF